MGVEVAWFDVSTPTTPILATRILQHYRKAIPIEGLPKITEEIMSDTW